MRAPSAVAAGIDAGPAVAYSPLGVSSQVARRTKQGKTQGVSAQSTGAHMYRMLPESSTTCLFCDISLRMSLLSIGKPGRWWRLDGESQYASP